MNKYYASFLFDDDLKFIEVDYSVIHNGGFFVMNETERFNGSVTNAIEYYKNTTVAKVYTAIYSRYKKRLFINSHCVPTAFCAANSDVENEFFLTFPQYKEDVDQEFDSSEIFEQDKPITVFAFDFDLILTEMHTGWIFSDKDGRSTIQQDFF